MHEMSVALHLLAQLEALAEEHGANAVTEIELSVGALQGVVPEALDLAFSAAAEGTIAGGQSSDLHAQRCAYARPRQDR